MEAATLSEDFRPEKQYTLDEFKEYMSSNLSVLGSDLPNHFVFWPEACDGHQTNSSAYTPYQVAIRERIKKCLLNVNLLFWDSLLIQFWEPKIIDGRRFLTTSRQPFAIKTLYKGPSWYRKHCTNHHVLVDELADGEGLGPLGRVFLSGQPESSPDLRFYSDKEFPLRVHALRCGLRKYMALPVFELQSNYCTGVLEFVSFNSIELPSVCFELPLSAFKDSELRLFHMDAQSDTQREGRKLALSEINQMFKVVNERPNIPLAMAWIPSQGCSANCNFMEIATCTWDPEWNEQYSIVNNDFLQACAIHKLQQGKGVAGRALSSAYKLCFCRSIYGFNNTEYPLAHYASKARLTTSFAICLQSAHTGSDLYVLEFFMLPSDQEKGDPRSLIQFLLVRMMRQLLSFKVASGQKWGDELLVEILRFHMDDDPVYFQKSASDGYPLGFELSAPKSPVEVEQNSPSEAHRPLEIAGCDVISSTHAGDTSALTSTLRGGAEKMTASFERGRKSTSFQISYQDIESHFGKRQKEAANILGVSVSKFKRACRSHNISRWPSHIRNKANHSLFEVKSPDKPSQEAGSSQAAPSCSSPSACSIKVQDTELVTVKANYQSKTVKFLLSTSSGIAKLGEEVAKRLKLKIDEFEMSYEEEDGHSILLTCDEDLCLHINELRTLGLTTIQLSVTAAS